MNPEQVDASRPRCGWPSSTSDQVKGTHISQPAGRVRSSSTATATGRRRRRHRAGRRRPRRGGGAAAGRRVWRPAASRWSHWSRATTTARRRRAWMPCSRPGFRRSSTRSRIRTDRGRRRGPAGRWRACRCAPGCWPIEVAAGPLREWLHKQRTGHAARDVEVRHAASTVAARPLMAPASGSPARRPGRRASSPRRGRRDHGRHRHRLADDPALTARLPDGSLAEKQPLRVVVGKREITSEARVLNDDSRTMVIRTHDPLEVMQGAVRSHRRADRGRPHAGRCVPAGRGDRPDPGLRRADPAGRSGHRGRRRRGAQHRQALRWRFDGDRPDRPGPAAQPGAAGS